MLREAAAAAVLTGLMILLFLGSWRSTLIVCISIPLSIFTSLAILYAMGETINIMTLGGMALAVGILVDDATVEIENIHRNIGMGKGIVKAILDGAQQIAVPAFRFHLVHLHRVRAGGVSHRNREVSVHAPGDRRGAGDGRFLSAFPHADPHHDPLPASGRAASVQTRRRREPKWRIPASCGAFITAFTMASRNCAKPIAASWPRLWTGGALVVACFVILSAACVALYPYIGTDFFPQVDAGQIRLHVRAASGARIEETEQKFAQVEQTIREDHSRR